jgi:N-acetylglucosamine kinase-like BadF-type ATPase
MKFFLGIDVGATKTHALIANETGQCLGLGNASGGNYQDAGYAGLASALKMSFKRACQMSDISAKQIAGAGFGITGYDFPSDREQHLQAIATSEPSLPCDQREYRRASISSKPAGWFHLKSSFCSRLKRVMMRNFPVS